VSSHKSPVNSDSTRYVEVKESDKDFEGVALAPQNTPESIKLEPTVRFKEWFDVFNSYEKKLGDPEPLSLRSTRPFLLSNEVSTNVMGTRSRQRNNAKKGKKGSRRGGPTSKFIGFSPSKPPPSQNRRPRDNSIYVIEQSYSINIITSSTTLAQFAAFSLTVAQLDDATALSNVFDQYRVDFVELWVWPKNMGGTTTAVTDVGILYSAVDYDDANAASTLGQMEDFNSLNFTPGDQGHYISFKPHIAVAAYSGAFTSFTNASDQWIDWNSTGVQHYGLKFATTVATTAVTYTAQIRLTVSNRNVR